MRVTGKKQGVTRISLGRLLVIWRELNWYFDDKQGLYRAFLEKQAQEKVTELLDLLQRESSGPDETAWLADLADLLLGWMEGGQTALRRFLFSGLEQDARSKPLSRLHRFLTWRVQSRLAARYPDEIERSLSAHCFIDLIFHFGLTCMVEGKWPSGAARDRVVRTILAIVLVDSAPDKSSRDPKSDSDEDIAAWIPRPRLLGRRCLVTGVPEKREKAVQWKLTDDDKAFLRSCNISAR